MIKFRIGPNELELKELHWVDARFVVAEHPETGKPALFIREDEYRPFVALNRLGMRLSSGRKLYGGVTYYDLEVNDGSEVVEDEKFALHGESGHSGVQDGDYGDLGSQGT